MDYQQMLEKCNAKISSTVNRTGNFIPYIANQNGLYCKNCAAEDLSWWTNGFWAGIMWLMNMQKNENRYREVAIYIEEQFDKLLLEQFPALHHDVGFMWMHTALANYRQTDNILSKRRALHAANILAARYNPNCQFLVAWNWESGWMIVDSLMNIPILFWASEEFDDERFRAIAIKHLDTALEYIVRDDGSANHICAFDPQTGEFLQTHGGQGYDSNSSWSRGLAWVIYGMTIAYKYTNNKDYLNAAVKSANYFIANCLQHDYIAPIDFKSPPKPFYSDATATAIVCSALIDLQSYVSNQESENYMYIVFQMLKVLDENYCDYNTSNDGILQGGAERYKLDGSASNLAIVYGDYFLIEALMKLNNYDVKMW